MAVLTQDELTAQINTLIADNDAGTITEPVLRQVLQNIVDTAFDLGANGGSAPDVGATSSAFSSAFS